MTDDDGQRKTDGTPGGTGGPRGTMADVSHTPPAGTDGAEAVFARGGEQLGPPATADAAGRQTDIESTDDRSEAEHGQPTGDGRRKEDDRTNE
ncbi:MAG: hypothetical protein V5A23_06925 [Halobacteriales archaeon]